MKNIVLTGFMASGKTVVGQRIAQLTGYRFVDLDVWIEKKMQMTVSQIFERFGEGYFRDLESEAARECAGLKNSVISCGGGAVLRPENIENLRKNAIIFNLDPSEEVIAARLSGAASTRPLLKEGDIEDAFMRFRERKPFYDRCDWKIKIELNQTIDEIAKEILAIYRQEV